MKEFLVYIHAELSRITSIYGISQTLEKEDTEILGELRGTLYILENFATKTDNRKLYGIVDDLEYSIAHVMVTFKAEAALKDALSNISQFE